MWRLSLQTVVLLWLNPLYVNVSESAGLQLLCNDCVRACLMWLTAAQRPPWGSVFICYVHLSCHSPFRSSSFSEHYGTHSYLVNVAWCDTSYPPYIFTYLKVNYLPSRWCFLNLWTRFLQYDSSLHEVLLDLCAAVRMRGPPHFRVS